MTHYLPPYCAAHRKVAAPGCPDCRRYARERWRAARDGLRPRFTDPAPVIEHLQKLLASGMSRADIARAAGMSKARVNAIVAGESKYVLDRSARLLLAVSAPRRDPVVGIARRLQALAAAGWREADIYRRLGGDMSTSSPWLRHLRTMRLPTPRPLTWERIAAVYDELWMSNGSSTRTAAYARQVGWLPPEAWDVLTIDDPDAQPYAHLDPDYVDEIKIKRALDGQVGFAELSLPERRAMLREAGVTDPEHSKAFRNRYEVNLQQIRVALGLVEDGRRRPGVNPPDPQVGARVKAALKQAGIYQQDLAAMLGDGCSPAHISRRVLGKVGFPDGDLQRIAELTGTSAQYLRWGVDSDTAA